MLLYVFVINFVMCLSDLSYKFYRDVINNLFFNGFDLSLIMGY